VSTTTDSRSQVGRSLAEIAGNLWFSWNPAARSLFARLDPTLWQAVGHNPKALLAELGAEALDRAASDPAFAAEVEAVHTALAAELHEPGWWATAHSDVERFLVAYFSAEFGVDESLPVYSGGLGVLAGDHLKATSELGVPLVGVGLFYRHGYFRQDLDISGHQVERYPANDPERLPVTLERDDDGSALIVRIELAGEQVAAQIWRADVGRTRLYLLDTDVDGNSEAGRAVTSTLYGGDRELRLRQELVLGIGGVRALLALGLQPTVFHMNEGHSAFLALERARALVDAGLAPGEALEQVRASTVFTTHTPVPAGNEVFDPDLVRRYVGDAVAACGFSWDEFAGLALVPAYGSAFGMTPFALRTSAYANGVSALHGAISRRMWAALWPERPSEEAPISHITNGVHARTWLAPELEELLRAHGVRPDAAPGEDGWERALQVDDAELWRVHQDRKRALVETALRRFREQAGSHGEPALDPETLTIGFARRFATYKRAGLLFSDQERLTRLLGDPGRPLQVLIAGKAHPADEGGKTLIQQLVAFSRDTRAAGRVVFLEDYEIGLARALLQGVDVWLNTPRRPQEASGTSGMKGALNGVLNVSILDGWWAEGYAPEAGWAIGGTYVDPHEAEQDARDAAELYRILEEELLPAYYRRGEDGLPADWLRKMKASIARFGAMFNAKRMVVEYVENMYLPAHRAGADSD
jgi:starch phosphorylase